MGNFFSGFGINQALGLGSDVFNALWSSKQQKEMLAAQAVENQKNRDFNERMVNQANMWNLAQWNRQNEYNLPANEIVRLKQAGINPALYYSKGGMSLSGSVAPSPVASSSGGISPVPFVSAKLDNMMALAQIDNIKADTANKRSEGSILESDAKIRDALNTGMLDLNNAKITLAGSQSTLTEEQVKLIAPQIRQLNANIDSIYTTIDKIKAETNLLDSQAFYQGVMNKHADRLLTAQYDSYRQQISESKARETLTFAEFRQCVALLPYIIAEKTASIQNIKSETALNGYKAGNLKIDSLKKKAEAVNTILSRQGISLTNGLLDIQFRAEAAAKGTAYQIFNDNVFMQVLGGAFAGLHELMPFNGGLSSGTSAHY